MEIYVQIIKKKIAAVVISSEKRCLRSNSTASILKLEQPRKDTVKKHRIGFENEKKSQKRALEGKESVTSSIASRTRSRTTISK